MLKLLQKISLVILLAFLLSIGVDYFYRQAFNTKYEWPENLLALPEIADKYEIVALGNSHSESGVTFQGYKVKSLRLVSVAQSFEYDFAMLKMHSKQIRKGAVIIINASPLSFSQKVPEKEDDVNMNYYDGRLSPYLIPHLKVSEYLQIQIVPFVRAGYLWREKNAKSAEETAMDTFAAQWKKQSPIPKPFSPVVLDTPVVQVVATRSSMQTFNVWEIQTELNAPPEPSEARLIASMHFMVNKWYNSGGFDPQYFAENRQGLEELIAYCLQHNWRPVLITLPISQVLLEGLNPNYLQQYVYDNLEKMDLKNIDYFNFATNTQLTQNRYLFSNSDHLNEKGAATVSYLLLQELIKIGYLPKEADGYDYTRQD